MKQNKPRHKPKEKNQQVSRTMSWLLRHGAVEQGIKIDSAGFISVDDLLQYLRGKGYKDMNFNDIKEIVQTNDKKRYELKQDKHNNYIRATQGHTIKEIKSEDLLKKIEDPTDYPVVIHGTYMKFWHLIKKDGLKRMGRNHIHFAPGRPKDKQVVSGMRGSCDVIIQIDMQAAMKAGIEFFISTNNVILTQGDDGILSPKFFKSVVAKNGDVLMGNVEKKEQQVNENKKVQNKKQEKQLEKKQMKREQDEDEEFM